MTPRNQRKRIRIATGLTLLGICFIISIVSYFVDTAAHEKMSFPTPQAAFEAACEEPLMEIVVKNDLALLVYTDGFYLTSKSENGMWAFPKQASHFKTVIPADLLTVTKHEYDNEILMVIGSFKKSAEVPKSVSDNVNGELSCFKEWGIIDTGEEKIGRCYYSLFGPDEGANYIITVDGMKYPVTFDS